MSIWPFHHTYIHACVNTYIHCMIHSKGPAVTTTREVYSATITTQAYLQNRLPSESCSIAQSISSRCL